MNRSLTSDELLVLGGLLRILVRLDGTYTAAENTALRTILQGLASHDAGFFQGEGCAPTPSIWDLLGRAARELPDEEAVKRAAGTVTDRNAREAIHAAVHAVAESDGVVASEQALLDWLVAWKSG